MYWMMNAFDIGTRHLTQYPKTLFKANNELPVSFHKVNKFFSIIFIYLGVVLSFWGAPGRYKFITTCHFVFKSDNTVK